MQTLRRDGGPETTYNARPGIGSISPAAYAVRVAAGAGAVEFEVPEAIGDADVAPGATLRYDWFPVAGPRLESRWDATAFALDVEFGDGTVLSETDPRDQHGNLVTPDAQADAKTLYVDQWNRRTVVLPGAAAHGIRRIIARVRGADHEVAGWLDGVRVVPARPAPAEPLDRVDTTRGTQSSDTFSRGNTAPLVAVPHGGVFGLPMTNASAANWPYAYHQHNRDDARPAIQAFATSHIPSPWIGDRGVFQVMPSPLEVPDHDRAARALGFDHDHEIARPHLYDVELDGGIRARVTAGDFALALRFERDAAGPLSVIVDHLGAVAAAAWANSADGFELDAELDDGPGKPRHFVHLRLPAGGRDALEFEAGRLTGHVAYAVERMQPVDALIGISTIDAAQARANLDAAGGFDAMAIEAGRRWREKLGVLELEGAGDDQARSLYSDLYRLFLYPNAHAEADAATGALRYRSPVDGALRSGAYSANNGFWDTYRTCWPALALLTPGTAAELAQGFVQHFTDGGWTSRWSAPGPVDSMTGTTSDTVFADLAASEVDGFDLTEAYRSARVNATVPPPRPEVGRKGLHPGSWRGFIDTETHEGMSWTLDNAINDWGTAVLARALIARTADPVVRERLATEAEYFERRSTAYRAVFNPDIGGFLGRTRDGDWRMPVAEYNPDVWGFDYTETNGWGTAYTAPHDGAGVAELHGGEAGLAASLDRFFATPETADPATCGSYGFVIHEQTEARDVRMGMLGLSNQPAHHIPFFYLHAGRHDDAHRIVTEARDRLFVGSDFGQGFPGDEDNGEMSGWHLFASLGFYPLTPASDSFVLTPPLLPRVVLRPEGGGELVVTATNAGAPYIRRVRWNGADWNEVSISRRMLRAGGQLEFELSDTPTGWAADSRPVSASGLHGFTAPPRDLLARVADSAADDLGAAPQRLESGEQRDFDFAADAAPGGSYTITLAEPTTASWVLEGVTATGERVELDRREGEVFERPGQLRPFRCRAEHALAGIRITALSPCVLLQIEMLD